MRLSRAVGWTAVITAVGVGSIAIPSSPIAIQPGAQEARVIAHLVVGERLQLFAGGRGAAGRSTVTPIVYRSMNPSVATVAADETLLGIGAGTTTIIATALGQPEKSFTVIVNTPQHATNMFVSEVCANVDSAYFMDSIAVTTNLPRIHEYHDCQRLIERQRYSAVVGIFAAQNVQTYQDRNDYAKGRLTAIMLNFAGRKDTMTYAPLGIKPGTNCLVMRYVRSTRTWEAAVVSQTMPVKTKYGLHYGDCSDSLTWADVPAAAKGKLVVREQFGVDLLGNPVAPPVARWDWDPRNRVNYMGVKCGTNVWCEIGPLRFASSPPRYFAVDTPQGPGEPSSKQIIKGYYDEQFLSDSAGRNPSTVFGTIVPGVDAKDKSKMAQRDPAIWYQASAMTLREHAASASASFSYYVKAFSALVDGTGRTASSDIRIRPKSHDHIMDGYDGRVNNNALAPGNSILFTPHSEDVFAPTVRWRWKTQDEGTWAYCDPKGCCEYTYGQ